MEDSININNTWYFTWEREQEKDSLTNEFFMTEDLGELKLKLDKKDEKFRVTALHCGERR